MGAHRLFNAGFEALTQRLPGLVAKIVSGRGVATVIDPLRIVQRHCGDRIGEDRCSFGDCAFRGAIHAALERIDLRRESGTTQHVGAGVQKAGQLDPDIGVAEIAIRLCQGVNRAFGADTQGLFKAGTYRLAVEGAVLLNRLAAEQFLALLQQIAKTRLAGRRAQHKRQRRCRQYLPLLSHPRLLSMTCVVRSIEQDLRDTRRALYGKTIPRRRIQGAAPE